MRVGPWASQKTLLPFHYNVYLAEVAPKKAAAANVETVFSGAGKFMQEALNRYSTLSNHTRPVLLL